MEFTFKSNSQLQTGENGIILDGIELLLPENRTLESLVKRLEDASIQVDWPHTRKSNLQRKPDEISRASCDTSSCAQSRLSAQTTNAPVETEPQFGLPQNEGSSMGKVTLSPLRPGLHQKMTSVTSLIPRLVLSFCGILHYYTSTH